jgi:hypothetical protein
MQSPIASAIRSSIRGRDRETVCTRLWLISHSLQQYCWLLKPMPGELIRQAESLRRGERSRELVNGNTQFHSPLPKYEILE